ncbi:transcriptional regulator [Leptospira sp. mixed culture ATI2-C-A1]|nr:transcriptional regulator [Leptospira sp. mixed culture ATI2-C-A1]
MLIGEFAEKSKLTRETIRFYEKEGLLEGVRKENNYRYYSKKDIEIVQFISSLKNLGFTLPEIRSILLVYSSELKCKDMQMILEKNLRKVEEKLRSLINIKNNLSKSRKGCEENPNKKSCNVFTKFKF